MGSFDISAFYCRRPRGIGASLILFALAFSPVLHNIAAQEVTPYTLHVYTNLIQIPTLVLSPSKHPLPLVDSADFSVSLDSGRHFHPTHVRIEGEDPIMLAILLDASSSHEDMLDGFNTSLESLRGKTLHPQDSVSIFAVDCGMVHSAFNVHPSAGDLKRATDTVLNAPELHGAAKGHIGCGSSVHLWDALARVTDQLSRLPGRRVILAITRGEDGGSSLKWTDVRNLAQSDGVTIFGLREHDLSLSHRAFEAQQEDFLTNVCELSGGLVLSNLGSQFQPALEEFISLVRGRYIIDFPRPQSASEGTHSILVSIATDNHAFIRPAGAATPLPDPALALDPTTIPPDVSHDPEVGSRKPRQQR